MSDSCSRDRAACPCSGHVVYSTEAASYLLECQLCGAPARHRQRPRFKGCPAASALAASAGSTAPTCPGHRPDDPRRAQEPAAAA